MDFKSLRIAFALLLPLLWVDGVWAVDCASTDYELNTQAEVDALGAEGCDSVSGYIFIYNSTDITNVNGLANLTSVGGYLRIEDNLALTNLSGLANITSVGDFLHIRNNPVTNLDGLTNLTSVGGYLFIGNNAELTNLDGLASLTSVGGYLFIYSNGALTSIDGLASLTSVGGYLDIRYNAALTNLDGLISLTSVEDNLGINGNAALTNLGGLANITSVGGALQIYNNALTNLDGLANITSVGGLEISYSYTLTNLDGLANITSVGGSLNIQQNPALTNLSGLANITSVGDILAIADNATLTNLDGLVSLTSVGSHLQINSSPALTNLDGLASLKSVGGILSIYSNAALTNLDGLASLTSVGSDLQIYNNRVLSGCQGIAPVLGWPSGPPADTVVGYVDIGNNGSGCYSVEQILASVSGPTRPVINQATASSNSITLGFTSSTTTDTLFPITGYGASCTGSQADVSGSPATDLLDNTPIQETLTVAGYDPTAVLSSIEVDINITHSDPTDLYITLTTPEGTELVLWNQGSSGGEDLVGTFPTTLTAVDSLDDVTRQTMDGSWVLSIEDIDVGPLVREGVLNSWGIRITEELARNGSGSPVEVLGATRGRDYTCTVAPVTKLGTTPESDPYTVSVPLELPSVPTITSTDYEDGKIILTVSVSDNGGADITGYEATCTDGTNTYTGTSTSSPITVSGLTNDVAYTCTVTATNSVGTSSASAATDPITPVGASGLPIWLLYQATQ